MAQGQKYDDRVRERALALLATNMSARGVAAKLGVAESTVRNWKRAYLEENPSYLTELRAQKRAEF
ncbi:MAG: helix-turn-helix domain-containing protein, partial [Clostridia bacterium]|nr:helix-turn-helix domain-containing protein [Clostridia bacterium]